MRKERKGAEDEGMRRREEEEERQDREGKNEGYVE